MKNAIVGLMLGVALAGCSVSARVYERPVFYKQVADQQSEMTTFIQKKHFVELVEYIQANSFGVRGPSQAQKKHVMDLMSLADLNHYCEQECWMVRGNFKIRIDRNFVTIHNGPERVIHFGPDRINEAADWVYDGLYPRRF